MKQRSKKGFSLIELIVVIAVIAAIAAVIVPQFGNMSAAAKNAADQRNIQLWNETYSNAYAMVSGGAATGMTIINTSFPTANNTAQASAGNIDVLVTMADGTNMTFNAPGFSMAGNSTVSFTVGTGLARVSK